MTKAEWNSEIRSRLKANIGSEVVVARASDLMKVLNYKDAKNFKKMFLADIKPCCNKQYSIKDFIDANYGKRLN